MPFDGTSALNETLPLLEPEGFCGCTTSSYGVVASNGDPVPPKYILSAEAIAFVAIAKRGGVPLSEVPVACVHHVSMVPLGDRYVPNAECASFHEPDFIATIHFALPSDESEK